MHHDLIVPKTNDDFIVSIGGGCQVFGFGTAFSGLGRLSLKTSHLCKTTANSTSSLEGGSLDCCNLSDLKWILVEKTSVKLRKTWFEKEGIYDKSRRIQATVSVLI